MHRFVGRGLGRSRGVQLGHRCLQPVWQAGICKPRRLVRYQPCKLDIGGHICKLELGGLKRRQRPPELPAPVGIITRRIETCPCEPDRVGGDTDAPAVQHREHLLQPVASRADEIFGRDPHAVERHRARVGATPSHLGVGLSDRDALRIHRHEQHRKFRSAVITLAGSRKQDDGLRQPRTGIGDELFGAVDDPMIAVENRPGAQARRIGPCIRLGQAECAQHVAPRQWRQPFALDGLVGEVEDAGRRQRLVGDVDRNAAVGGRVLFDHQRVGERSEPGPPYRSGIVRPKKPSAPISSTRS